MSQVLSASSNYLTGEVPPFLSPGINFYDISNNNFAYALKHKILYRYIC